MPRTKKKASRVVPAEIVPENKPKKLKDARISVIVEFPNKEPMEFSFHVTNAEHAISRPRQQEHVWRRAVFMGLKKEYGGIVKPDL